MCKFSNRRLKFNESKKNEQRALDNNSATLLDGFDAGDSRLYPIAASGPVMDDNDMH
jgi:hypothetical protein